MALVDDAADAQRKDVDGVGIAFYDFGRQLLQDHDEVSLSYLRGDTLDAADRVRLNFNRFVSQVTNKGSTNSFFHAFLEQVGRVEDFIAEIVSASVSVVLVIVLAIFKHLRYRLSFVLCHLTN